MFNRNTSPGGAALTLPGPTGPREEEEQEFHPIPPVAGATGSSCVGPPGLDQVARNLCCSNTPYVYPPHQPRRGGTTSAGADRPRGGRRIKVPSYPTGGCRHRQFLCRPSGPGTRCEPPLLQQHTSCLPAIPAPEGRHYLCRGRQAPGRKKNKSSILSHRWLLPPAVTVSALRA
jgi:hypothetical protein